MFLVSLGKENGGEGKDDRCISVRKEEGKGRLSALKKTRGRLAVCLIGFLLSLFLLWTG